MDCVLTRYTGPIRCFNQFIPDLGLASVSAALKQAGYTCTLIDLDLPGNTPQDLYNYVALHKPSVLAVKVLRLGFQGMAKIIREVKRYSPSTLIVGGGAHARIAQETLFELTDFFDALLVGESDRAMPQVMEVAQGRRTWYEVENAIFRAANGQLVKNPMNVVADLDTLPFPDWGLYDLERYLPIFLVSARRGCPFTCAFCNFTYSRPPRVRTASSLLAEVANDYERYGARLFSLADSLPEPKLTRELCDGLIALPFSTRWISFGRIKYLDAILDKMRRAGWVALWFGIESGSERILKIMQKGYTPKDIRRTLALSEKAGIQSVAGFIMGFPGEDEESLAETLRLSQELPLTSVVFSPFVLNPGSLVGENPQDYSVRPYPDWAKTYAGNSNLYDIPYFEVNGEDNVSALRRYNALIPQYQGFSHRLLMDDADYAALLASCLPDASALTVIEESDRLLKAEDFQAWNAWVANIWKKTAYH
jgi:anaerobic magnesium-protoporphyrin IX monomethyl ester cyclase